MNQPAASQFAVEYVRMSTSAQDQSIALQRAAIARYASEHGWTIVRSYADEGISGTSIKRRRGLQELLRDVQVVEKEFTAILVYDVSRWGRFERSDESAYYEFHCRLHGARVVYVAEQFDNDDSMLGTLVKNMKRAMAAEYSRELGEKVAAGHLRILQAGFSASHHSTLGYRRQVISVDPARCVLLKPGERKSVLADKIRVVLGPPAEQALVKRIFRLFATTGIKIMHLADQLNAEGHRTPDGRTITHYALRNLLGNELYIGTVVWGRKSKKGADWKPGDAEYLHRFANSAPPLIEQSLFDRVQRRLELNSRPIRTRENMLADLAAAIAKYPGLNSYNLGTYGLASGTYYAEMFGSVGAAYALVNHRRRHGSKNAPGLAYAQKYKAEIAALLIDHGATVICGAQSNCIWVNGWRLLIQVCMPVRQKLATIWRLPTRVRYMAWDLFLVIELSASGKIQRTYLVTPDRLGDFPYNFRGSKQKTAEKFIIKDVEQLAMIWA